MTDIPDTLPSCLNPLVLFFFFFNAFILIADNVPDSSIMLLVPRLLMSSVWEYV